MPVIRLFDIEANAKEPWKVTTVHCIAIAEPGQAPVLYGPDQIYDAVAELNNADVIVAHNAVMYDVPVLKRLYGLAPKKVLDTILVSRLLYPDFTQNPIKGHALANWGTYLKCSKGDYHGPWDEYSDEMGEYCIQDVVVLDRIFTWQRPKIKQFSTAVKLEHAVAEIIYEQRKNGVGFRRDYAEKIVTRLSRITDAIDIQMQEIFPPEVEEMKTPEYWTGKRHNGEEWEEIKAPTKGELMKMGCPAAHAQRGPNRKKYHPFSCGSRDQIGQRLIEKYKWKPTKLTPGGKPQIDDAVLSELPFPEAKPLARYFSVDKKISMVNSWLEVEEDGKIFHNVITNGTVTGRMAHSGPNLGQVPSAEKPLGKMCRRCFVPFTPGRVMVGGDLSGLELRILGHFLFPYDKGAFLKIVLEGDVHTNTQVIINSVLSEDEQIPRRIAKNVMYAVLYGAGPKKIALMLNVSQSKGRTVLNTLKQRITGLGQLLNEIERKVKQDGWLPGIDGRRLPIRSAYAALNTLIQSAGGLLAKLAWVIADRRFHIHLPSGCWAKMLNVHDEAQYECDPEHADTLGAILVSSFEEAGKRFKLNCPITGTYSIGPTWRHTH